MSVITPLEEGHKVASQSSSVKAMPEASAQKQEQLSGSLDSSHGDFSSAPARTEGGSPRPPLAGTEAQSSFESSATAKSVDTSLLQPGAFRYNLLITGPVGVGKTTICDLIEREFRKKSEVLVTCIPEYLEHPLGPRLLEFYLNETTSNTTFQNYIMDYYDEKLTKVYQEQAVSPKTVFINIFERSPEDSLLCFANLANRRGKFSDEQLLAMLERVRELDERFRLPSYLCCDSCIMRLVTDDMFSYMRVLLDTINEDIAERRPCRIVFLTNKGETIAERIRARARPGEENYTAASVSLFLEHYERLYGLCMRRVKEGGRPFRFVDLGGLFPPEELGPGPEVGVGGGEGAGAAAGPSGASGGPRTYKILITGVPGVGKTTLCEGLVAALRGEGGVGVEMMREYVSEPLGLEILAAYMQGWLSDMAMQMYIHDFYQRALGEFETRAAAAAAAAGPGGVAVQVFERVPDDGLLCFSNKANMLGKLSDSDFLSLFRRLAAMRARFKYPSYFECTNVYALKTTARAANVAELQALVARDIAGGVRERIVFLENEVDVVMGRLRARAREGEEGYTVQDIRTLAECYERLKTRLAAPRRPTRFVDIGEFLP